MKVNSGIIVLIGAISYGIPASIFKMATNTRILPANLLISQVLFAALILICINYIRRNKISYQINHIGQSKLLLSGLAMASTNTLYFTSLQYVSVTISAVLLMQSVWIAMIFSIISSIELPSAILFAYILLNEQISLIQMIGIFAIIFAVAYPNLIAILKNWNDKTN